MNGFARIAEVLPRTLGRMVIDLSRRAGELMIFAGRTLAQIPRRPFPFGQLAQQLMRIGWTSLPVVAMTTFFSGAVLALQIHASDPTFGTSAVISRIVAIGITRELGPVLTGLMVAGRVAAAIAAETGAMRVTEQIDALTTLSANPHRHLVAPRLLAAAAALPLLALVGDAFGIMGGFLVSTQGFGFNAASYLADTVSFLETADIVSGVIKAGVFGVIIALMGSYSGFRASAGAQGVGLATTNAVVASSIMILAANYTLTALVFT